jgi:hypothetical protein
MLKGKTYIKTYEDGTIYLENNDPEMYSLYTGKTEEEMLEEGYLIDKIPIVPVPPGKKLVKKYSPASGLTQELIDIEGYITQSEEIQNLKQDLDMQINYSLDMDFRLSILELGL